MTRDLVWFTLGFVLAAIANALDRRYQRARGEWEALFRRVR